MEVNVDCLDKVVYTRRQIGGGIMATDVESRTKFKLTRYYGGDSEGMKLQITEPDGDYAYEQNLMGAIQLNAAEALVIAEQLREFALAEVKRRQEELRREIEDKVEFEKTIFREIADLEFDKFGTIGTACDLVLKFTGGCEPACRHDNVSGQSESSHREDGPSELYLKGAV